MTDLTVVNGWPVSDGKRVPSFCRVRATLSGDTGCFVAMDHNGWAIFRWDNDRCECFPPNNIPPIEIDKVEENLPPKALNTPF